MWNAVPLWYEFSSWFLMNISLCVWVNHFPHLWNVCGCLLPTFLLLLLSFPNWFIHDRYCIFVGYMYCKYLFPICGSSFSFMTPCDEIKFLIFYDQIHQYSLFICIFVLQEILSYLKVILFSRSFKVEPFTFKSITPQKFVFLYGNEVESHPQKCLTTAFSSFQCIVTFNVLDCKHQNVWYCILVISVSSTVLAQHFLPRGYSSWPEYHGHWTPPNAPVFTVCFWQH